MKTKVVYYTKTGHTEKIAKAIGSVLNVEVANIDSPLKEQVDILFLGASVYNMGVDKIVLSFIDSLNVNQVGSVVIFSTSATSDVGYSKLKKRLQAKGIKVHEDHFYCKGGFLILNKNRPNEEDVNEARKFAKSILKNA